MTALAHHAAPVAVVSTLPSANENDLTAALGSALYPPHWYPVQAAGLSHLLTSRGNINRIIQTRGHQGYTLLGT